MSENYKLLALIPARSGSKRLKNKNILKLKGKTFTSSCYNCSKKISNI